MLDCSLTANNRDHGGLYYNYSDASGQKLHFFLQMRECSLQQSVFCKCDIHPNLPTSTAIGMYALMLEMNFIPIPTLEQT